MHVVPVRPSSHSTQYPDIHNQPLSYCLDTILFFYHQMQSSVHSRSVAATDLALLSSKTPSEAKTIITKLMIGKGCT